MSAPREEPTAEALEAAAGRLLLTSTCRPSLYRMAALHNKYGQWSVTKDDKGWSWRARGAYCESFDSIIAAAVDLLRHHPELWPAEPDETAPEPQPLTVAAREALRLLVDANHGDDGTLHHCCYVCSEPWPCEVEQARRILADALAPGATDDARAAALVAVDALQQEDR